VHAAGGAYPARSLELTLLPGQAENVARMGPTGSQGPGRLTGGRVDQQGKSEITVVVKNPDQVLLLIITLTNGALGDEVSDRFADLARNSVSGSNRWRLRVRRLSPVRGGRI